MDSGDRGHCFGQSSKAGLGAFFREGRFGSKAQVTHTLNSNGTCIFLNSRECPYWTRA
jgi:hypothetical protein